MLATGKVRHVGELVAMCVADTRAEAEDLAESVQVDYRELPVVVDMMEGRRPDAPLVHEEWGDNVFLRSEISVGDMESVARTAAVTVKKEIRTARQCMSPMEGRGVVAYWDYRLDSSSSRRRRRCLTWCAPGLAECLGPGRGQGARRDVGGGFGYKCILLAEEVASAG